MNQDRDNRVPSHVLDALEDLTYDLSILSEMVLSLSLTDSLDEFESAILASEVKH